MSIPIIVISYNRKSVLEILLKRLDFYDNIIVLDNNSTYEPLLDFYSTLDRNIVRLNENVGHLSPWLCNIVPTNSYYAVTDCDIVPSETCPNDFVDFLKDICASDQTLLKAGLSLKVDDLPDTYGLKERVIEWESQFWVYKKNQFKGVTLYDAAIDTTFAVYAPNTQHDLVPSIRVDEPYAARHLPWYMDTENLTDEEVYYRNSMRIGTNNWNKDLENLDLPRFN